MTGTKGVLMALTVLLLAGCGLHQQSETVTHYQLTLTDKRFTGAIHANTQSFYGWNKAELATMGHGVCHVLQQGGVITQAAASLPVGSTIHAQADATYFANLARQDYCPQYPATKLLPKG